MQINIIDTNVVQMFCDSNLQMRDKEFFIITDDIQEEISNLNTKNDSKYFLINKMSNNDFDSVRYYINYKYIINKYTNLVSFYNLTGIGDISILAYVKTILETNSNTLFTEEIFVYTEDEDLSKALIKEFPDSITVKKFEDIKMYAK